MSGASGRPVPVRRWCLCGCGRCARGGRCGEYCAPCARSLGKVGRYGKHPNGAGLWAPPQATSTMAAARRARYWDGKREAEFTVLWDGT